MLVRLYLIAALFLCSFLLKSQSEFQYIKVRSTSDEHISNANLKASNSSISYFSSEAGVLSIYKDSLTKFENVVVSSPRHNPKKVETLSFNSDTTLVVLDPYKPVVLSEEKRIAGFKKMKPVFLKFYSDQVRLENEILQKRILYLNEIPLDIRGVSGRVVPGENDLGKVLGALRWSDVDYKDKINYQEKVLARIDSGLFRDLGSFSSLHLVWNLDDDNFSLYPFSNLEYPSPIKQAHSLMYNYYLVDSVKHGNETIFRIDIKPTNEYSPLFSGTVWQDAKSGKLIEAHLGLYYENHVYYVDSLQLHFYNPQFTEKKVGAAQHVELWVNILGYKMKFDVNTILLNDTLVNDTSFYSNKLRVIEPMGVSDSLDFLNSIINGNTSVLDRLENTNSISSKNYKVNSILYNKVDFARAFFLTGGNYYLANGHIEIVPLALSMGFNTVEGWYVNYRAHYHLENEHSEMQFSPYLRYGFASKRWLPRAKFDYKFIPKDPILINIEGGVKYQQFNEQEPINPFINTVYSLTLSNNYLKIYQKEYLKFTFDKEIFRGLEAVFSIETAKRTALFNNTGFTIIGDGSDYTPNNPERAPVISETTGFKTHNSNIVNLQFHYQFGRRYDFVNNKLRKLESPLPRFSFLYRKSFGFNEGMPDYNFIRFGLGNKTRIKDYGIVEMDFAFAGFYNVEHMEFVDYHHFNGVQTAFLNYSFNGVTYVRQFSTLPYYDYSTSKNYVEVHLKHRFLGWLLSRGKLTRELNLQSYVGANYLFTSDVGQYSELLFGVENIFKVINLQTAVGVDRNQKVRFSLLLGINFDYTFYLNARKR